MVRGRLVLGRPCQGLRLTRRLLSFQGTVVYLIMIALGEMTTLFPNNGGFTGAATRFLDPAFGFAIGWVRLGCSLPARAPS